MSNYRTLHSTVSFRQTPQSFFDFVRCSSTQSRTFAPASISNEFICCINRISGEHFSDFFGLHGTLLVRYEDEVSKKPFSFLDLNCASIRIVNNSVYVDKKDGGFELKFLNEQRCENWLSFLQNFCVQTNFDEKYLKQQMIKEGSLAKIYTIQPHLGGKVLVAKAFDKSKFTPISLMNFKEALLKQISFVQNFDPRYMIQLHELYETEDLLYLTMDLIQGASLKDLLSIHIIDDDLSEQQIQYIFYCILECALSMASQRFKHRDLKPENILIQPNGDIKLIDLGLKTYMNLPEDLLRVSGSPGYIAPEAFNFSEKEPCARYDHRCEVFSAGCILFEMLYGRPLFEGNSAREVIEANKSAEKLEGQLSKIKKEIKDKSNSVNRQGLKLLMLLLEPDYKKRISATDALQHKYFSSIKVKPSFKEKIGSVISVFSSPKNKARTHSKGLVSLKEGIKLNAISLRPSRKDSSDSKEQFSISISTSGDSPDLYPRKEKKQLSIRSERRTSLYYSIKNSSDATTASDGYMPELQITAAGSTTTFLAPERAENNGSNRYCIGDFLGVKNKAPEKLPESFTEIEDEGSNIGSFMENIKHKEISKSETKMSRFY